MTFLTLAEEPFSTLEGEGKLIGTPTLFVRLSRCNLRCTYCDSKFTFKKGKNKDVEEIVKIIEESGLTHVSITGGEPLLQREALLILLEKIPDNYHITLETNGTRYDEEIFEKVNLISMDIKGPSANTHQYFLEQYDRAIKTVKNFSNKIQFKFVISTQEDLNFVSTFYPLSNMFIQVVTPENEVTQKQVVEFLKRHLPNARLGIRLHVMLNLP